MSYVLVTPARNEEAYIEETLKSVVAQEERPDRWIIVSDGSTDCTDAIIEGYAAEHPFIRLMRKEGGTTRDFASCVFTMLMGIEAMQDISYDFVGILDADIRLDASYYRAILKRFHDDPKLGLAGGALYQRFGDRFVDQKIAEDSVAGGVQLFRRECYEDIGGLIPIPNGGWDPVAEVTARMKGWTTQTFGDIPFYHLKPMNSAAGSYLYTKWQVGERDYLIGNHPLFELFRCAFRVKEPPFVISSLFRLAAYVKCWITRTKRPIPKDVIAFKQQEQLARLKKLFRRG